MTLSSADRRRPQHEPLFDIHPVTGASIQVFYADRTLESFGRSGAGWFWHFRRRGFALNRRRKDAARSRPAVSQRRSRRETTRAGLNCDAAA